MVYTAADIAASVYIALVGHNDTGPLLGSTHGGICAG
jgi:hypothetical protein